VNQGDRSVRRVQQILLEILLGGLILLVAVSSAAGHDIGTSNGTFWVRGTGIDVELYMGLNAAALLIAEPGQQVAIAPNAYSDYADRLQAVAPNLFTLTAADGSILKPDAASSALTAQADVLFELHYPLPAALPGNLTIHCSYLDKMVDNHIGSFYVMNAVGDHLGYGEVRPDSEDVIGHLPAADALVGVHPAVPVPVIAAATQGPPPERPSPPLMLWVILAAGVLVLTAAVRRTISRKKAERKSNDWDPRDN
jgi:hypothetical protein